jgi:acetyl esterase/lipase
MIMCRLRSVILVGSLVISSANAADTIKIACVGNSLTQGDWLSNPSTQGYVALLQKMLGTSCKVMNYGLSGRTMLSTATASCTPYIKESKFAELFTVKPDIITIELGTNESRASVWTSPAAFEADYAKFIDSLSTISITTPGHAARPLIMPVLCTPCTDNNTFSISGTTMANQINPSIRKVAAAKGCPLIDMYTPFLPLAKLIPDGVHPDTGGNRVEADVYYENLQNIALKKTPQTRWLWYGRPTAAGAPGAKGDNTTDKPMLYVLPAPDNINTGAAVIICPGGGYTGLPGLMNYEGIDVAKWFNTFGVSAFVLQYRYSPYRHPTELNDVKRAMRIVRYSASSYGIDSTRIGIMGFSAGGHLASTIGTHFDAGKPSDVDPIERKKSRPDFLLLIYPVITLTEPYTHTGSRDALLGTPANAALVDSLSNQKWVNAQTPPTFLAHGDADNVVPIQNSRMFDSACKAFNVPDTLVVDPGKGHGYGMSGIWPAALKTWMGKRGLLEKTPVQVNREGFRGKSIVPASYVRYSAGKGFHLAGSGTGPDCVRIFSIDGRCTATFRGALARNLSWKPAAAGMYLVRMEAGGTKTNVSAVVVDR